MADRRSEISTNVISTRPQYTVCFRIQLAQQRRSVPPSSEAVCSRARATRRERLLPSNVGPPGTTSQLIADACSPVKTYNGEGVSREIKFLHSQIYSGRTVPKLLASEQPRMVNGVIEQPMQQHAIRAVPYDRATMLDPLSKFARQYPMPHPVLPHTRAR